MAQPEEMIDVPVDARALTRAGYRSEQHAQRVLNREARRIERDHLRIDPDDIMSDIHCQMARKCGVSLPEQELSNALQEHLSVMTWRIAAGAVVTREEVNASLNQIGEEHGYPYGIPMPLIDEDRRSSNPLVLARGVPMRGIFEINQDMTEMEQQLRHRRIPVRNSWDVLGDQTVCVVDTEMGPMAWPRTHAGARLRKLINTTLVRSSSPVTAEGELRAMESLKKRISETQWNTYVLNGCFGEISKRSDLHYIFRKGYPTIVLSFHGKHSESGKVLAALCLHPMGYYAYTFAGLMTPTDEVIAALLMMRADEHKFWAKSGQWSASDTRSGV